MTFLLLALLAGALTVLAPCVIVLIPILLARTAQSNTPRHRPVIIIAGLGLSIITFSILLKSTTLLLGVPDYTWRLISGIIVVLFGLSTLLPGMWEWISIKTGFAVRAQRNLSRASDKKGWWGDLLLGASLGPVFSACSPTYALIVAGILPADLLEGLIYLLAFVVGLSVMLGLIAIFGQALISRLRWGINPKGVFRRVLGVVLIIIGIAIMTGWDKTVLAFLVEGGWFDWQINLESNFM